MIAGTYCDPKQPEDDEAGTTFGPFVDRFLREYQGRRGAKSNHYRGQLRQITPYWKDTLLTEIDRAALDLYRRWLANNKSERTGKPLTGESIRKRLRTIGTGGGLILSPTHHVQLDTPLDNFWAMVDTIRETSYPESPPRSPSGP